MTRLQGYIGFHVENDLESSHFCRTLSELRYYEDCICQGLLHAVEKLIANEVALKITVLPGRVTFTRRFRY